MNPELRAAQITLMGLCAVLAVFFQVRQWRRDCDWKRARLPPARMYPSLAAAGLALAGFLLLGVYSLLDPNKPAFQAGDLVGLLARAVFFGVMLNTKVLLSPVCVGFALGDTMYYAFEYGVWHYWPTIDALLDWLFDGCPQLLKYIYLTLTSVYALVSSVLEEWLG